MISADVIIVGGGPGGSSCAWQLRKHGIECIVLDRATFPRLKLCGGLITPEVIRDLEIDVAGYPHSFFTIKWFRFYFKGRKLVLPSPQHSIRRIEFDKWLLDRSGAEVHHHHVKAVVRDGDGFVIDDTYRCRYLVGAGGTSCPVYRSLFRELNPRAMTPQIAALEEEFPWDWQDGDCHLWFFDDGLPGYSWYIPKAGGHLNVGVGGMAATLKRNNDTIKRHWDRLIDLLRARGFTAGHNWNPGGYTYHLRGDVQTVRTGNAFLVGDAAGLGTRDLGEGIRPAIETGIRAANSIALRSDYTLRGVVRYSSGSLLRSASKCLLHIPQIP